MKRIKSFWVYLVIAALAIMVSFSMSSCNGPNTPAPTMSPTPVYPAPILISPATGTTIVGEQVIEFSWQWDLILQEEEGFDLRIWRREKSSVAIAIAHTSHFILDLPPDGFGEYLWQVAVIRIDENGNPSTLSESQERSFVWTAPMPTSTATSTPTPTATGTPTSTPTSTPTLATEAICVEATDIFAEPDANSVWLADVKEREIVTVIGRSSPGNWFYVRNNSGAEGFVWRPYFSWPGEPTRLPVVTVIPPGPTPTPTDTPTPTLTPTNTSTLTPTPTGALTGTPTDTPISTPTRFLLPAPILLEPPDGAEYCPDVQFRLEWEWDVRPFQVNEYYAVRIWKDGSYERSWHWEPDYQHTSYILQLWDGQPYYDGSGSYFWNIVVLFDTGLIGEQGYKVWEPVSEKSETWRFVVYPMGHPECQPP